MFRYDLKGYAYMAANAMNFTWSGFLHTNGLIKTNSISNINGISVNSYVGSDNHLYLKFGPINQYFNSYVLDYQSGAHGERIDHSKGGYEVILTDDDTQL